MSSSSSSATTTGMASSSGDSYTDSISAFAYDMAFVIGFILLAVVITVASYTCMHNNHRPSLIRARARARGRRGLSPSSSTRTDVGIDEATLRSYPVAEYSSVKKTQVNSSADPGSGGSCCSICLGDYKESDVVRSLPECGHFFHVGCVDQWLRLHATCPVCRKSPPAVVVVVPPAETGSSMI